MWPSSQLQLVVVATIILVFHTQPSVVYSGTTTTGGSTSGTTIGGTTGSTMTTNTATNGPTSNGNGTASPTTVSPPTTTGGESEWNWAGHGYWALAAVGVYGLSAIAVIVMLGVAWITTRVQGRELDKIRDTIPISTSAVNYSVIPIEVVAMFAGTANVEMPKLCDMYRKDSMERRAIVMRVFGWNQMTARFLVKSTFMKNGYAGEQVLLSLDDQSKMQESEKSGKSAEEEKSA